MVQQPKRVWFYYPRKRKRCFRYFSAVEGDGYKSLEEGQEVEFEITKGPKGEQATNVRKA